MLIAYFKQTPKSTNFPRPGGISKPRTKPQVRHSQNAIIIPKMNAKQLHTVNPGAPPLEDNLVAFVFAFLQSFNLNRFFVCAACFNAE